MQFRDWLQMTVAQINVCYDQVVQQENFSKKDRMSDPDAGKQQQELVHAAGGRIM